MKKITLLQGLLLTGAGFMLLSTLSFSKSNPSQKHYIAVRPGEMQPGEDNLALAGDTLHTSTGNAYFTSKNNNLFVYVKVVLTTIDSLQNKMDTTYLRKIYDSATTRAHGTNYVTVLQIKYGIHASRVILYYKPLCLTRDSYNTTTKVGTYSNHNSFDSCYYTCSPSGFIKAPYKNQFQKDSLSYADSMQIRHHAGGGIGGFYTTNNDSGDVNSIIFSFQEIYALVKANNYSKYVKFCNIGETATPYGISFNRHGIMMGPNDLPPSKSAAAQGSGVYFNVYADLGNMCPPSCSSITFLLQ